MQIPFPYQHGITNASLASTESIRKSNEATHFGGSLITFITR